MRKLVYLISGLFVLASTFVACSSYDEPDYTGFKSAQSSRYISPAEACDYASAAFESFGFETRSRSTRAVNARIYSSTFYPSRLMEGDSTFYIVDFADGGFAVVAAERDVYDRIYAISDKGSFDASDNPELQIYMNTMGSWVGRFPYDTIKESTVVSFREDSVLTHHERYVPVDWNQNYPYNQFCPIGANDQNALTGCAAVAMGQVMAFHRIPEKIGNYKLLWDSMLSARTIYRSDLNLF